MNTYDFINKERDSLELIRIWSSAVLGATMDAIQPSINREHALWLAQAYATNTGVVIMYDIHKALIPKPSADLFPTYTATLWVKAGHPHLELRGKNLNMLLLGLIFTHAGYLTPPEFSWVAPNNTAKKDPFQDTAKKE